MVNLFYMKNPMFEDNFCKKKPIQLLLEVDTWKINQKTCFQDLNFLAINNTKYYIQYSCIYSFFLNKNRKLTQFFQLAS